jgi:hypothetical protein
MEQHALKDVNNCWNAKKYFLLIDIYGDCKSNLIGMCPNFVLSLWILKNKFFVSKMSATTLNITTFSIITLSIKGFIATLCINDIQYKNTDFLLDDIMLSVAFYLFLC